MISVRGISHSYGGKVVLRDISFEAQAGECVAILGNNGAGKSTLITCIGKIKNAKSGEVDVDGQSFFDRTRNERARTMSYVAQKSEVSQMTVMDAVLLGRKPYISWALSSEDVEKCAAIIEHMELEDFRTRSIDELSGGELQKVMLARALAQEPRVLLLDEPTSNLDPKNQHDVLSFVQAIAKHHQLTVLIVLHDISHALRYCDKFLLMQDGAVYSYGDDSTITEEAIFDIYGVASSIIEVNNRKVVIVD
ncbi:MAG: ABC transporter ATP-binding protein [Coriobacteriia bacterium]|nr:ABC transporter ATP-binding protein [Coriobacteriia bacterium]MCL2746986.1 ABC transporter ATP-binding protein [Coriobacteriia bacterium]MCL2870130.1 ABC transporter ATP-binding protein [Coriobacteriia bacterium]